MKNKLNILGNSEIEQMKYIYKKLDEMFDNREFEKVDEFINFFVEDNWNFQLHVCLLAATLRIEDRLKNRDKLKESSIKVGTKEIGKENTINTLDGLI